MGLIIVYIIISILQNKQFDVLLRWFDNHIQPCFKIDGQIPPPHVEQHFANDFNK